MPLKMHDSSNYFILDTLGFQKEVIEKRSCALVEFTAAWSGTGAIVNPVIRKIARIYNGTFKFYSIDADSNRSLLQVYGIRQLPTFLFFDRGNPVDQFQGVISRPELVGKIEKLLNT